MSKLLIKNEHYFHFFVTKSTKIDIYLRTTHAIYIEILAKQSYMSDEIVKIPLRNRKKEIIGHAIISKSDEENVKKHKWHLSKGKYEASITHNYKKLKLGYFELEIQAAKAYNDKALELHGKDYKHFNIISP